jgi:hypothetical protein
MRRDITAIITVIITGIITGAFIIGTATGANAEFYFELSWREIPRQLIFFARRVSEFPTEDQFWH